MRNALPSPFTLKKNILYAYTYIYTDTHINTYMYKHMCQSVVSDSLWPDGLQPTRFHYPWNSLGKNTGVFYILTKYWSGQPFPSTVDLPNPGTELMSPALQTDFLPSGSPGKPFMHLHILIFSLQDIMIMFSYYRIFLLGWFHFFFFLLLGTTI